ncbi:MAG: hypothetical protein ACR2ND_01030 [Solirubrobacteraceae bacterium]
MKLQLAIMLGAFVLASLLAAALGASFGHAITFGQLAFAAALMYVLVGR